MDFFVFNQKKICESEGSLNQLLICEICGLLMRMGKYYERDFIEDAFAR